MRALIFKVICFLALFIFMQGAILPWAISNNFMPLWADVILITLVLIMWLAIIDRIAFHFLKLVRTIDEPSSEGTSVN